MINGKSETTLIQLIPESINIKNYYPDKINEQALTIRNNCNIPLILSLSSSDSSLLILKDSSIKIGKKQKKVLSFIIKDKNYKKNKNTIMKPKKLYIFIKNDLVEEKFEIILSYYPNISMAFSENKQSKNREIISFNSHIKKKINSNENKMKKDMPNNIKKVNLCRIIKNTNNSNNINTNNNNNSNKICLNPERMDVNNRYSLLFDDDNLNVNEINESERFNFLLDLKKQISYLKQMLEHSQMKIQELQIQNENYFFGKLMKEKCISFCIIGNNFKELYRKNYRYNKSKKEEWEFQNFLLKEKNQKLIKMIQYLKQKLYLYENEYYHPNANYNRNKNYIINNYNYN
jgi:hypothetical protein